MPSGKKGSALDGAAIAKAIADDLPGWKLARTRKVVDDALASAVSAAAVPGATLSDLRRKFLGADADAVADAAGVAGADDYGTLKKQRTTVQVEPDDGGP